MRLSAPHPYLGDDALGELTLTVLDELPGREATALQIDRAITSDWRGAWIDLAGPYHPERPEDAAALLALLWDLTGAPMLPDRPQRPAARVAVVRHRDGGLVVYRDAEEVAARLRLARAAAAAERKEAA
jgi:hypothetical protein